MSDLFEESRKKLVESAAQKTGVVPVMGKPAESAPTAEEGPGVIRRLLATGSRVAGPYVGGLAGASLGSLVAPGPATAAGLVAGSAAGGGLGEAIAEKIEGREHI